MSGDDESAARVSSTDPGDIHDRGGVHGDSHANADESPPGAEPTVGQDRGRGPDPSDPQATMDDQEMREGDG